ncbi:MAG: decaprenyl-phosphate phosphoribosyltransferase [Calditrichaeota bacterium]|nr:MAG: decaprenyl-phosphate phosphoribosyltransferase [Calditrichota bacterium]
MANSHIPDTSSVGGLSLAGFRQLSALFEAMRPKQWSKNLLLFAGLIFSENFLIASKTLTSVAGFAIFCLLSSSVYILNDIIDIEKDKNHPLKRNRPLPSGRLTLVSAYSGVVLFSTVAIASALKLNLAFGLLAILYFTSITLYSLFLKNYVIIDVIVIALGFVLRAVAGTVVIQVELSNWLLICTFFMALFLALCKRRHELVLLGDGRSKHRKILNEYSTLLLDQMLAVVTAATIITYALYTMAPDTIANFGTNKLVLTIPFVLFGIFRYFYLVYEKDKGGSPENILLSDRPILLNILLYGIAVFLILYT